MGKRIFKHNKIKVMMEKQSKQMKTEVQTFFVEEVVELIHDPEALDEWKELSKSMGMVGHDELTSEDKSPIPFLYLKNGMVNVFSELCPIRNKYTEFNRTPVPLEILRLMKLSKDEGYFSRIEVWYDDKAPDPCVMGINEQWVIREKGQWTDLKKYGNFRTEAEGKEYINEELGTGFECKNTYGDKYYLLGKWGDVKHSMDKLKEMATLRRMKNRRAEIETRVKDAERELEDLINSTEQHFA